MSVQADVETQESKVVPTTVKQENTGSQVVKEKKIIGVVTDCLTLAIRKSPSRVGDLIDVISALSEVTIIDETQKDFYKVITNDGITGFCMKKFVALK